MSRRIVMTSVVSILCFTAAFTVPASGQSQTTWADFSDLQHDVVTTLSLGGGSSVDVRITTGGTQELIPEAFGTEGVVETGLAYDALNTVLVFNGGGTTTVNTTIRYTNFVEGDHHLAGCLFVGGLSRPGPITATSNVAGSVEAWFRVGNTFVFGSQDNTHPVTWDPLSGQFVSEELQNCRGIVLNIGALSQYDEVVLSLDQHLDDGVSFSIGESIAVPTPSLHHVWGTLILGGSLVALWLSVRRRKEAGAVIFPEGRRSR